MKKLIFLIIIVSLLLYYGPKQEKVEKIIEGGVEVVINHIDPYKIKGEPTRFNLEEELTIDTEREDLAELGIAEIRSFDVDAEGNIYCVSKSQIFNFDQEGNFIQVVGRNGQGPGEFLGVTGLRVTSSGEISFYDSRNNKFLFLNRDGTLKEEIKNTSKINVFGGAQYLDNGNYLFEENKFDPNEKKMEYQIVMLDKDFNRIKELDGGVFKENPFQSDRYNLFDPYIGYQIFNDKVYLSNSQSNNLEIDIYNFQGKLVKKIRKEPKKVKISDDFKQKKIEGHKGTFMWEFKDKFYFPDYFPPFVTFYIDDQGRILVETYESGENPDEYMLDILNPEGIFVGRISLKKSELKRFKHNRLYCIYEKESGFQELVVYKMKWE